MSLIATYALSRAEQKRGEGCAVVPKHGAGREGGTGHQAPDRRGGDRRTTRPRQAKIVKESFFLASAARLIT
jgi:hypothetical protein